MKKISIIVPVYNSEEYLQRCVDSILNQTFKEFELILVNDGSKDNSGKICDNYALKDNRIKVIHKTNGGVSSARNVGINHAHGEYIMFVDSDDYIAEQMLEKLLLNINNNVDLMVSSIKMISKDSETDFVMIDKTVSATEYVSMYCQRKIPRLCLEGPCCKIFKSNIIKKNNIKFIDELDFGEDEHFNMKYLSYCTMVRCCKECYYYYIRENETSLSSQFFEDSYEQIDFLFHFDIDVMKKLECSEEDFRSLEKIYSYKLISNIPRSLKKSYRDYISFVKKISANEIVKNNWKTLSEFKHCLIGSLLFMRGYHIIYVIIKLLMLKKALIKS